MRSHILRDIVAGCAGALLVFALIGLPGQSLSSSSQQPTRAVLLPAIIKTAPCFFVSPQVPGGNAHAVPCPLPAKPAPLPAKPAPAPRVPSP